jgi:hypothetical protein
MKAILFFITGAIFFFSIAGRVLGSLPEATWRIRNNNQKPILAATVMITIMTPNWQEEASAVDEALPIPNDEYRAIAKADGDVVAGGLGTLVVDGKDLLLVTHDHWSHLDENLGTVTFQTADGVWLADIDLCDFKERIRSRDGGSMVLVAPGALKSAFAVDVANARDIDLQPGNHGFVTRRSGDSVVVSEVRVIGLGEKQGRPVVQLQSIDGQAITGGDSGGGVWFKGRLTAVMWTTVRMQNQATGEQRATDMSVAALYPFLSE